MIVARKFIISGLVQGVGFRFFTQRAAARHQVHGYVRNLTDGRVEPTQKVMRNRSRTLNTI
jgi:acylphosphatase